MKTKRFLSILLSLVLVLGMLPGMSLTASAADTTTTITSPATTGTMTITLAIAAASVKTAPEANTLTYSGSAQTLTTTGEAGVGTLQYQLGESATTEPTGTWGTTVPQGTEAKDYYVWYRSCVNDNNISTAGCKTVTIAKASITNATVTLSDTSLVYTGLEQSVTVSSVKLGDTTLTADTDYEVTSGTTGTAKNTYTVTVTGKGNYKDTATAQWSIGLATPTIETIPTASAITYGQKLANSTLTGGVAKLGDTTVAGTFAWKNTETKPAVSDSNATEYDVVFTPTDADNYAAVECKVKLTVNKAAPTVTAPTAKTLTYTGSAQALVNAGSTNDGTIKYAVTTENKAPTDESLYTTSIPTATNAGTYYVWYKVLGDTNHKDSAPAVVSVTMTLTRYTIIYEMNGGSNSENNPSSYTMKSEDITLSSPAARNGYTFIGWTGSNGTTPSTSVTIPSGSSGNKSYTANWQKITYKISFDLNGGELGEGQTNPTSYDIESEKFSPNAPTKKGYDFEGWLLSGDTTGTVSKDLTIPTGTTGDREYIAQWSLHVYALSYDLQGGIASPYNPTSYTIESADIKLTRPTKQGYDFTGWSFDAEISLDVTLPKGSTGDRNYVATWGIITYTISYDLQGGNVSGTNPTSYNCEANTFKLTTPTRTGYTFAGWTGTGITGASRDVTIPTGSTGNREYTATWTAVEYTISYTLNNGSVSGNPTKYKIETETFMLNNPTKNGYQFDGWTGTDLSVKTQTVTIPKGSTGNRNYMANFSPIVYMIS